MNPLFTRLFACGIVSLGATSLIAQTNDNALLPEHHEQNLQLEWMDDDVVQTAQRLGDWSKQQYPTVSSAVENLWKQNGWNAEADLYAKNVALEVSKIPPWDFVERLHKFSDLSAQRYRLDQEQHARFQNMITREAFGMSLKYGPLLLQQTREILNTRLEGRPFSPDQVARWVRESDPLVDLWRQDVQRITSNFGELLTDSQREVFEHDLQSLNRRLDHFIQARQTWREGGWRPEEWGLQNDPLHQQASQPASQSATQFMPPQPSDTTVLSYDESTWHYHVAWFADSYQLDQAQRLTCTTILNDMVDQAGRYRTLRLSELGKIPISERNTAILFEPIRAKYDELRERLACVPTELQAQRAARRARRQTPTLPSVP